MALALLRRARVVWWMSSLQRMRMGNMSTKAHLLVCADFDQTITTRDTIALLFDAGRRAQQAEGDSATARHHQQVKTLVDAYMDELSAFVESSGMVTERLTSLEQPRFDGRALHSFLDGFSLVDLQSIQRVVDSKTLRGIHQDGLEEVASQVEVMEGCVEALGVADEVCVISSNWSGAMLRVALDRVGLCSAQVIANELAVDEHELTTGDIQLHVQSPRNKAAHVAQKRAEKGRSATTVFIGDSTNDVLAMLEADVGITLAFAAESTLVRVCRQFGIDLRPVSAYGGLAECRQLADRAKLSDKRVLFTASSWAQIHAVLATRRSNVTKK